MRQLKRALAVALALGLAFPLTPAAWALPQGWNVVSGNVSFEQAGNTLNITSSSQQAIIEYISFNLANGETVNFFLPNTSASILNRVIGGGTSVIAGQINSNGQLGIVNSAGIILANTAQVHAASFLASTLNINNADFLSGKQQFERTGNPAGILNEGQITVENGGHAALIGSAVINTGEIIAPDGQIHLVVGDKITFHLSDQSSIQVTVDEALQAEIAGLNAAIQNHGLLAGKNVEMQGKLGDSIAQAAVNNTGLVIARDMQARGGKIVIRGTSTDQDALVYNSGIVDSGTGLIRIQGDQTVSTGVVLAQGGQGEHGGRVEILGDEIMLAGQAIVDVNGDTGGGTALIGGDYQGTGNTHRAQNTFVGRDVYLGANAGSSGDGGKVIVWADQNTSFYGQLEAKGGEASGNGGFAEVSGKEYLDMQGHADLTAANGHKGTLLLDPTNINIIEWTGPGSIGDLRLWLDASDINGDGSAFTNGANVSTWVDKSGNGANAFEGNASNQPIYQSTGLNGNSMVYFNNEDRGLQGNITRPTGTASTIYMMGQYNSASGNDKAFFEFRDGSPRQFFINQRYAGNYYDYNLAQNTPIGIQISDPGGTTTAQMYQNGITVNASGVRHDFSTSFNNGSYTLGDDDTGGNRLIGGISELLYFDRALTTDEIDLMNQHMESKWGVSQNINLANVSQFSDQYLEYLSQTSDISLQADQNIVVEDLSDNLLALGSRNFTLTATNGTISFNDTNDLIRTEGGDITFNAGSQINIGNLDTRGASGSVAGGNITMNAGDSMSFSGLNTQNGAITLNSDYNNDGIGNITWDAALASKVNANGGDIGLQAENVYISTNMDSGGGDITIEADYNNDGAGTVDFNNGSVMTSNGGNITLSGDVIRMETNGAGIAAGAGNVTLIDDGVNDNWDIRLRNNFTITGNNLVATGTHDFDIDNSASINMTGTIDITTQDDFEGTGGGLTAGGNVNVNAFDTINVSSITSTGGSITLSADHDSDGAGNVAIGTTDVLNASGNPITLLGQNITISNSINTAGGNFTATANRAGTGSGYVNFTNNALITTGNGDISLAGDRLLLNGGASSGIVAGSGDVTLTDNGTINNEDVRLDNGFNLTGRNLTINSNSGFYVLGGSTINMTGPITANAALDITVDNSTMNPGAGQTLTLNATRNINIQNGATVTSPTTLTATAGNNLAVNGATLQSTGAMTANAGVDVNMANNGLIRSTASTVTVTAGDDLLGNNGIFTAQGDITLNANDTVDVMDVTTTAGDITISADHDSDGTGNFTLQLGNNINTNGGDLTLLGQSITLNDDVVTGGGVATITANRAGSGSGVIDFNNDAKILTNNGNINLTGADFNFDGTGISGLDAGTGDITITENGITDGNDVYLNNAFYMLGRNLTVTSNHDFDQRGTSSINMTGWININANDDVSMSGGTMTAGSTLTFNAADAVSLNTGVMQANGNISASSGADFSMNGNAQITSSTGTITVTAGDDLWGNNGIFAAQGNITLNANRHIDVMDVTTTAGDITISADHDSDGTGNFTLQLGNNINTNGGDLTVLGESITLNDDIVSGGGHVTLTANRDATGGGVINFNNDSDITTNNGNINLTAADYTMNGVGLSGLDAGTGDITITENGSTDGNDVRLDNNFYIRGRNLTVTSNHDYEQRGSSIVDMSGWIDITANDDFIMDGGSMTAGGTITARALDNLNATNSSTITATGDIDLSAFDTVNVSNVETLTGNITLSSDENLDGIGNFTLQAGNNILTNGGTLTIEGENVTLSADINSAGGDVVLNANRDAAGTGQITQGAGTTINTAGGDLTMTGADFYFDGTSGSTITVGAGDITITENNSTDANDIRFNNGFVLSGRNVTMTAFNDILMQNGSAVNATGNVSMTATGDDIDAYGGSVTAAGTVSMTAADHLGVNNVTSTGGNTVTLLADENLNGVGNLSNSAGGAIATNGGNLIMRGENVNINDNINTGGGTVTMTGNRDGAGVGYINFNNTAVLNSGGGNVTMTAADYYLDSTNGGINAGATGDITITENGSTDANDLRMQNNFNLTGRNITLNSNADLDILSGSNIDASGNLLMNAADQLIANGGGQIHADGFIYGTAGSTITAGDMDADGNLGLVSTNNFTISGPLVARGSAGWNGGADESMVIWSTGGRITGTGGLTTTGAGNMRIQAGSTGNLGAGNYIDISNVSASQNLGLFATGATGGRAIRLQGTNSVAGHITATGMNAANQFAPTTGSISIPLASGNLTTALIWSGSGTIDLTANNGSILQNTAPYSGFSTGVAGGKTIWGTGAINLTANGGANSYVDTGVMALTASGTGGNVTIRASGQSGSGVSVNVRGRADGNMTISNIGGTPATGDIYVGSSIGASQTDLEDSPGTVTDVMGNLTISTAGRAFLYGSVWGNVTITSQSLTGILDKGPFRISGITTNGAGGINMSVLRGSITGNSMSTAAGQDIFLQAGSQTPRDKLIHINVTNVNSGGNLDVVVAGSTNGLSSGQSVVITGSSTSSSATDLGGGTTLGTVSMP